MHALEIIVETPKGSPFKYKYDPKKKWFQVHKMLPVGLIFPFDFGFIPGTKAEDGDPLDILVLSEFSFTQGCMVNCNVIGSIKAEQTEGKKTKGLYPDYKSLEDIQKEKMKEIKNFFIYYNLMENKTFSPIEILTAKETWKIIKQQRL